MSRVETGYSLSCLRASNLGHGGSLEMVVVGKHTGRAREFLASHGIEVGWDPSSLLVYTD
jgi:hypothetical protein